MHAKQIRVKNATTGYFTFSEKNKCCGSNDIGLISPHRIVNAAF